jgi:hypothetical protein
LLRQTDIFTYDREVFKRKLKSRSIGTSEVNFAYVVVGRNECAKIFTYDERSGCSDEYSVGTRTITIHCSHFYDRICIDCRTNRYNDVIRLFIKEICKKYNRTYTEMRIVYEDDFYMFIEPIYHAENEPNYILGVYDDNFAYVNLKIRGQHTSIIIQDVLWSKDTHVQRTYLVRKYSWRFTLINYGNPRDGPIAQDVSLDCDIKQLITDILVMFG